MKKKSICLVDDDPGELKRFKNALGSRFIIGTGQSVEQALGDLRERGGSKKPSLYLIDLYHPEDASMNPEQREELHAARREFLRAQSRFKAILAKLGQSTRGGFRLASGLPKGTFAFFTRKGTLEDVAEAYGNGAVAVIKKPDPNLSNHGIVDLDTAYDQAAKESADRTAGEIEWAIQESSWTKRHPRLVAAFWWAVGIVTAIGSSWVANHLPLLWSRG
jgi:hypothetical protein